MRVGGDEVTSALLDMPRRMSVRGLISVLPMAVKKQREKSVLNIYIADCVRLLTENTAKFGGGSYVNLRYEDIINPKPEETRSPEEVINNVKMGLSRLRGEQREFI